MMGYGEPVVERAPEFRGWRIRSADQPPNEGTIVTDHWLAIFGFSRPTKFNIEKIIAATVACMNGYTIGKPDLDREKKLFGDPFSERGAAPDIEFGEGLKGYR